MASYLESAGFLSRLQQMLALVLTLHPITIPPVPLSFLGGDLLTAIDSPLVAVRFRPGALMVGFDVTDWVTASGEEVNLNGDADQLADFAGEFDIAAAVNPATVPIVLQSVETEIRQQVASAGASLDTFSMDAGTDRFEVAGSAHTSEGSSDFSFAIVPSFEASLRLRPRHGQTSGDREAARVRCAQLRHS